VLLQIVYRHAHRDANVNCVRPINLARSLTGILESKRVDQCGQRSGLLSSARVVQEEARERLTPLLKNANERAGIEMRRGAILSEVRQADAIERRPNDQFHIVHDQWPIDRDRQRALALVELPAIDLVTVVSEVDAAVLQQIARRLGGGCGSKYTDEPTIAGR